MLSKLTLTLSVFATTAAAQTPTLQTVAPFAQPDLPAIPVIQQTVNPNHPLTITGARGAILGEQSGVVELWQLPVKVFSNLHLKAQLDGYTVPIDLNPGAATVIVRPGHTVLTYSFAGITVRQHMLVSPAVPAGAPPLPFDDPGAILYFEIDSVRPATLTVTLTPNLQQMWPAPQYGAPGAGWTPMPDAAAPKDFPGGAYTIATDNPALFGMIGMPHSRPGDIPVYQEHPQTLPLQFLVRYDPATDKGRLFPLLSTIAKPGERNSAESNKLLQQRLVQQAKDLPAIAAAIDHYYTHFFDTRLTAHTPDPRFDEALKWAALSIEDSQVEHRTPDANTKQLAVCQTGHGPAACAKSAVQSETGLVAGWFGSYDSARPGFGWYFGRDTLWSLYAIDSYGDTALSKRALEFLLHRQRADGKMMHEFSQMADDLPPNIPWSTYPYEYAAADATPLFFMALRDYVRTSGDTAFLNEHWDAAKRAWNFERTHDSDGDGVYDNSEGTGWVENWQSPMPHQELYLAALDAEAARAMAYLSAIQHDSKLNQTAIEASNHIQAVIETYRDQTTGLFAFSKNTDGTFDRTTSVYPAVALWEPSSKAVISTGARAALCAGAVEKPASAPAECKGLQQPAPMLDAWTGPALATDWGTRAISTATSFYDPISYHMGSVWPLFTGWNAMAQYNADRPAAAWLTLQQNLRLTWLQDPGTVTELLSGAFYQPLGRSSTHQLWSSAMTLAPAIRGLFGIHISRPAYIDIAPHLPITWDHAEVSNVRNGATLYRVTYKRIQERDKPVMHVQVSRAADPMPTRPTGKLCMDCGEYAIPLPGSGEAGFRSVPLPSVEFNLAGDLTPQPGDRTHLPHITDEHYEADRTTFILHAQPGATVAFRIRRNGTLDDKPETVTMPTTTPDANGYTPCTVTIPVTGPITTN